MRIASLLPSATEIVYALGLGDDLVGVTFECDYPPDARQRHPILVGGADTHAMDPAAIDAMVHATIAERGNLYDLQTLAIRDAAPDVILTQDLCQVCAVPSGDVDDALATLGCTADVVSLDPMTLDQVLDSITDVAAACGVSERGVELVAGLRDRIAAVADRVNDAERRRVFVLEWVDPPFLSGHWVPDLITAAGGEPVLCEPGKRSHETTWDEIRAAAPDVLIVAPCGFDADAAARQAAAIAHHVPDAEWWAVDANAFIVRPSHRLVDGVEILAGILHPDRLHVPSPSAAVRLEPGGAGSNA